MVEGVGRAQELLLRSTPFWTGGVVRGPGGWVLPGPSDFQGVAKIVNKQMKLVPAIAHPWQLEFDDLLESQRDAGLPMRCLVLKARKLGFSTWVALKFLQIVTQVEYQRAVVVAQDSDTAGLILMMALLAYRNLPTEAQLGMGFNIRPDLLQERNSSTEKYLVFGEKGAQDRGYSEFAIDSAKSPESGRGSTPSLLHLSEVARWEGELATKKMLGQLNALPYEQDTICVQESTANGLNHFYRRWMLAKEGAEDPDTGESYTHIFVPWHRDPKCSLPFSTIAARERFVETVGRTDRYGEVAEDEDELVARFELTAEQLSWRRMMIRSQHEDNVLLFRQENPATDEEAFIGSGRTVFAGVLISRAISDVEEEPAPVVGTLQALESVTKRSRAGTIDIPTLTGWSAKPRPGEPLLSVWEHPRKGVDADELPAPVAMPTLMSSAAEYERAIRAAQEQQAVSEGELPGAYVATLDVSEGEENTFNAGDYHCLQVFDHRTRKQVAMHESRMDLHLLAGWAFLVALHYNEALLAVEVNGPGIAVVDILLRDLRYKRLFKRKRIESRRERVEDRAGWRTDPPNKDAMEVSFATALQGGTHGLRDPKTARQLATYIVPERGAHRAQDGEHDDRLVAAMIAHRVMDLQKPRQPSAPRAPWTPRDNRTGY